MFLLLFLLLLVGGVTADTVGDGSDSQPGVLYANPNNFTAGGLFERNLNVVLDFLVNGSERYRYRYGSGEDEAFGYRRCFFKTPPATCSTCIQEIRSMFKSRVPLTIGARYWRNDSELVSCYLHYEKNSDFFVGISPVPNSEPPSPSNSSPDRQNSANSEPPLTSTGSPSKTRIYVGVGVGVTSAVVLSILTAYILRRLRKAHPRHSLRYSRDFKVRSNDATVFRYETLRDATGNFSKRNELGQGGFGAVYKGMLEDGTVVAVKKLSLQSHQGRREFVNEITIITGIQHRNLVRLKGYCVEEERLLVYEFMENGSLDKMLFGPGLAWKMRHAIMLGVARGLAYLHEDSHVQIIHRDIKANNILLDKELNPKISDFGISKLFESQGNDSTTTRIAGTLGYLAPEYATQGRLTPKVDVFSYGVLVLEIISGRRCRLDNLPPSEQFLLQWVWKLRRDPDGVEGAVDRRLLTDETYNSEEGKRGIHVALLCTQGDEGSRPMMSEVVAMFQGLMALPPIPSVPPSYLDSSSDSMSTSFVTANTSNTSR